MNLNLFFNAGIAEIGTKTDFIERKGYLSFLLKKCQDIDSVIQNQRRQQS